MDTLGPMAQIGAVGVILAWVLLQINPRLDRLETALNRLTKAQMLALINQTESAALADQAWEILKDLCTVDEYAALSRTRA